MIYFDAADCTDTVYQITMISHITITHKRNIQKHCAAKIEIYCKLACQMKTKQNFAHQEQQWTCNMWGPDGSLSSVM